jgi:Protein of unknown function (DUF4232)
MVHRNSRQAGVAHILIIALIAVVLIAIGYAVWHDDHSAAKAKTKSTPTPTVTPLTATPSPSPTASASPATTSACTSANLTAALTPGSGAAGTNYYWLALTNTGAHACTTSGYPGVSLLNAAGAQLGQPAGRNTVYHTATVTLQPHATAYALVAFPNTGNFSSGTCTTASAKLRVYPPGQATPILATGQQSYCPGFTISALVATKQ